MVAHEILVSAQGPLVWGFWVWGLGFWGLGLTKIGLPSYEASIPFIGNFGPTKEDIEGYHTQEILFFVNLVFQE